MLIKPLNVYIMANMTKSDMKCKFWAQLEVLRFMLETTDHLLKNGTIDPDNYKDLALSRKISIEDALRKINKMSDEWNPAKK